MALIRHGHYRQLAQAPSALQPFPLTQRGRDQAALAVEPIIDFCHYLQIRPLSVIDSSRMLRGWQTATIIARGLAQQLDQRLWVEETEALAERSVGAVANLTLDQIATVVAEDPRLAPLPPNWKADSHFTLPFQGAESLLKAGERVALHLEKRVAEMLQSGSEKPQLKLIVGHGAAFRHAAFYLGLLPFENIARLSMYHASPIFLRCDRMGRWELVAGDWKIREWSEFVD
ncbi:MAG: histidine phosphatase family protein [Gammaproteobacteria bacterium]|nr:histidine phosphatase family protein [Gammaproteobacteria bacterium]